MSTQYLLPCECGKKIPVETSQAGRSVPCECGRTLSVPTFRMLKSLPVAVPAEAPRTKTRRRWGPLQGAMFGVGAVALLVGGSLAAYWGWDYRKIPDLSQMTVHDTEEAWSKRIDGFSLEDSWRFWEQIGKTDLTDPEPPMHIQIERYADALMQQISIAGAVALVGLLLAIIALLL